MPNVAARLADLVTAFVAASDRCRGELAADHEVRVRLEAPLGGRQVVDAGTGIPIYRTDG